MSDLPAFRDHGGEFLVFGLVHGVGVVVVRERAGEYNNKPASWIAIAEAEYIDSVSNAALESLTTFDEWRGGCGLSLAVARRIIDRHAGAVWSLAEGPKTAAVVVLPLKP